MYLAHFLRTFAPNKQIKRLNMYNWQNDNWAQFTYNEDIIKSNAQKFAELSGEIYGMFKSFCSDKQQSEIIEIMVSEALKTSEIEGEILSRQDVRSSFLRRLGMPSGTVMVKDKRAENVALLMLDVQNNYEVELSEQLIKQWHNMLFSNSKYINAGVYRESAAPMQIISGVIGAEKVHYEAPPASRVGQEMKAFVQWYNSFSTDNDVQKAIVKTAITHLYFESIHPFEDGNGRVGRALIKKCLSESLGKPIIMSISQTIDHDKARYYDEIQKAQSSLAIDDWLLYFSQLLIDAQRESIDILHYSLKKAQFFDKYKALLNVRQAKVINKMLDAGKDGFEGGMSAKKYISIAKTTKATATRDLQKLVALGILHQHLAGRSTHYDLNI